MEEHYEDWHRELFQALVSREISRNKFPETFAHGWSKIVHHRLQTIRALERDANRMAALDGTICWVSSGEDGLRFHLKCPKLSYTRTMAVRGYELEWLMAQQGVGSLLDVKSLDFIRNDCGSA